MTSESTLAPAQTPAGLRPHVAILYKQHAPVDEQVLRILETELTTRGYSVFVDHFRHSGLEWAREVERQICSADIVIPLLSPDSVQSDLVGFEIETAHDAAQHVGHPIPVPVRLQYRGPLPEPLLQDLCESVHSILWEGPQDDRRLVSELVETLERIPSSQPAVRIKVKKGLQLTSRRTPESGVDLAESKSNGNGVEAVGGAVPLHSRFYLLRNADARLYASLMQWDGIVLLHGPRQAGKSSMLARGLQLQRERGARVVLTDFQKFNVANFETIGTFFLSLAESLADQLDLAVWPADVWDERHSPALNLERYLRREVLTTLETPLVWGLDEVDRLFVTQYGPQVFRVIRGWHNRRERSPEGPWATLTVVMAYATEAHLFMPDLSRSPFQAGTPIELQDFTRDQVAELNGRHQRPLKTDVELDRFFHLVDGHPFLVRRGLQELVKTRMSLEEFEAEVDADEGIFGEHLQRILFLLARDPALTEVVRRVLRGQSVPDEESFFRLRSAGVMAGDSPPDIRPRCHIYASYLARNLL